MVIMFANIPSYEFFGYLLINGCLVMGGYTLVKLVSNATNF
jgi:hypothetical protein